MCQANFRIFFATLLAGALAGCATTPAEIARWETLGGYEAVGRIQPELHSPKPELRQAAITALLKLSDDQAALNALEIATLSPEPAVRGDMGVALLFNPNESLDFYSITLVADPDPVVRRQMAVGLAAVGRAGPLRNTQRAAVYLWGLTQDADADVRAAAVEGVGSLGLNDPIGFALDALRHDPEPRVRAAAARGLATLAQNYLAGRAVVKLPGAAAPTPERCEEVVAALGEAARTDKGKFSEVQTQRTLLWSQRVEETRWVASVAAEALTVPGVLPRADVAAALAAEQKLGSPAPLPTHFHLQSSHHPGPL